MLHSNGLYVAQYDRGHSVTFHIYNLIFSKEHITHNGPVSLQKEMTALFVSGKWA